MYVPVFNRLDDPDEISALVAAVGSAQLITVGEDGYPAATLLPVIWDHDRLIFHFAKANPQWRSIGPGSPALAVVTGPQAYVSPSWYPSKQEHQRVVPTWNYSAVHLTGRASVHTDPEWLLDAVTRLTEQNETHRRAPWAVSDAPEDFVARQLKAIVGVELIIEQVVGKAKLSQNRSADDHAGVMAGLRRDHGPEQAVVAEQMQRTGHR